MIWYVSSQFLFHIGLQIESTRSENIVLKGYIIFRAEREQF